METNVKAIELQGPVAPLQGRRATSAPANGSSSPTRRSSSTSPAAWPRACPRTSRRPTSSPTGSVGLITAIERFDLEREIKFETYAITRIKGAIIDELRSLDWVPRSVRARAREIERANAQARAPAAARADRRGDGRRARDDASRSSRTRCCRSPTRRSPRSTSCGRSSDASRRPGLAARHAAATPARPTRRRSWTRPSSRTASPTRSRACPSARSSSIALYYYENLTLREIGEVLGVTESRVSQLHTKAVLRLRGRMLDETSATAAPPAAAPPTVDTARRGSSVARSPRRGARHAQACGPHPQRGPGRPPRQRQDLAARGAAVRGRRDEPAGHASPTARRSRTPTPDEQARQMSISRVAELVRVATTARSTSSTRPASRASSPTRSARCACASRPSSSSTRVMGVEVTHAAAVGSAPRSSTSRA